MISPDGPRSVLARALMFGMSFADRPLAALARQLGEPRGLVGRVVGRLLNRGNRSIVAAAVRAAGCAPGAEVADIGFGGGIGLELALKCDGVRVHGVEMSSAMLAQARSRFAESITSGRLQVHDGRMEALPFDDSCLDAIISTNTVYFVEDLAAALREIARVLRPGGRLVLGVGDPDQMSQLPFTRHGFRLRPIERLVQVLGEAGFGPVEDSRVGDGPGAFHLLVCELPG